MEFENLKQAILEGNEDKTKLLVTEAIEKKENAENIMEHGMISAMDIVGKKMETEELFIPEVLLAARAMNAGAKILKPLLAESESDSSKRGTAVIGSVKGDLHDIGKNLVRMLMDGAGFNVVDLGTDVETNDFIDAVKENDANIIGMSALLTTTMPVMEDVIGSLEKNNLRDQVKVIVGGAPVTKEYAEKIGADAYGTDAGSAVRLAKSFITV